MKDSLQTDALQIAELLDLYLTPSGVKDPDRGQVLPYTYTTEFFAWLCALLFSRGGENKWLARAQVAIQAALDMQEPYLGHKITKLDGGDFHWEFKNLALIHTEQLIGDALPEALRQRLEQALLNWQDLAIDSTNWSAMRMVNYFMRSARFKRRTDYLRSKLELSQVLSMQSPEGLFYDTPHSRSLQYHAYILSLLGLYYRMTQTPKVREALLRGVRFIADFIDPSGEFNYFGRGQRQLFGYASLFLALNEAVACSVDQNERLRYMNLSERVIKFVRQYRQSNNVFPLVLNHEQECLGWYSYNRYGDYLAFHGVWLMLSAMVDIRSDEVAAERKQSTYARCYPSLGLAVVSQPNLFAVFASRSDDLSEPVGLIHLWPVGPSSLGGPDTYRSVGVDYTSNYCGPLILNEPVLQLQSGTMSVESNSLCIVFSLQNLYVKQKYQFETGLHLQLSLTPINDSLQITPFVMAAIAPPRDPKFVSEMDNNPSPLGRISRFALPALKTKSSVKEDIILYQSDYYSPDVHFELVLLKNDHIYQYIKKSVVKIIWLSWVLIGNCRLNKEVSI